MVTHDTLAMLRCPQDHTAVRLAEPELLSRLNVAVERGRLRNQAGKSVPRPLNGGLVREAGDLVYPIVDDIPVMLYEEAIPLAQLTEA
jgi:uncharacterized protein YbaR (Trm112 family)